MCEHTNFPTWVILNSEMVNKNDEFGMLPDLQGSKRSAFSRGWVLVFVSVSITLGVAWLAFDQISQEQQVLAKFSPPPPTRPASEAGRQERTQTASVSVTANAASDSLGAGGSVASSPPAASPTVSQSAPVQPVAAQPAVVQSSAAGSSGLVSAAFEQWVQRWQQRDPEAYLALYDAARPDLKGHLAVRSSRIRQAQFIEVAVSNVRFSDTGPSEVTVRFVQSYRSDRHQSRDTKELVWRLDGKQPKIIAERLVN